MTLKCNHRTFEANAPVRRVKVIHRSLRISDCLQSTEIALLALFSLPVDDYHFCHSISQETPKLMRYCEEPEKQRIS